MNRSPRVLIVILWAALWTAGTIGMAETQTNAPASAPSLPLKLVRDPFWPTGWAPPSFGQIGINDDDHGALAKWAEARKLLQVTGLSRGPDGKYLAILKGIGVVQEGDTVPVNYGDLTYRWKIRSIGGDGIVPEKAGASPRK